MKWDLLSNQGKSVQVIDLNEGVFAAPLNEALLHTVVKAYRANRRQGTHATKTRAFVSGGGKKPFKQKGTGGARQGSTRSPLMPGGAVLHGPQPRDYRQYLTGKSRVLALSVSLSEKVRAKHLFVVDNFGLKAFSTKEVVKFMSSLAVSRKCLFVDTDTAGSFLYRSARNIPHCAVVDVKTLNAEHVLRYESLVISQSALTALEQRLGSGSEQ